MLKISLTDGVMTCHGVEFTKLDRQTNTAGVFTTKGMERRPISYS